MNLHVLNMADGLLGVKSTNELFRSCMQRKINIMSNDTSWKLHQ